MDKVVRRAQEDDAEAACHVLRSSITYCCVEDHGGDQKLIDAWLSNKTPENLRTWLCSPSAHALVAEVDGVVVGVASLLDSGEVALCYVAPEVRFTGIGKALLVSLEGVARDLGLRRLHLESTSTARAFYARNGFEPCGEIRYFQGIAGYPMTKVMREGTSANVA